jgi:ParB family chromosome partitioning protein
MFKEGNKMQLLEIPVDKIYISEANVRRRKVKVGLDELKDSIRRIGLLQPIIVFQKEDKYELIVGQRRFLAVKELGWEKIPALVTSPPSDVAEGKIASLSENIHRKELPRRDIIDACDYLYAKYGSARAVAEELGVSESTVRNYLPLRLAPEPLIKMIEEKEISLTDARKAVQAGGADEEKVMKIAKELKKMTKEEKRRFTDIVKEKPEASAEEIIEEAKKPRIEVRVVVHLTPKWAEILDKAADDIGMDREDLAKTAIIDWLTTRGYV